MRVLLVEDDKATADTIELMLKSEGYVCDTTDLGEDGLEIGKLYDYDIIILTWYCRTWTATKCCAACGRRGSRRRP